MLNNAVELSHFYLQHHIKKGDFVIDATCGNGSDTLFLASLVGETGGVLGFDIQQSAIQNTMQLMNRFGFSEFVHLIHDGHEHMEQYLGNRLVDAVVFNLGYLPGGDHSIHTKGNTTVSAIETSLSHLSPKGIVVLCIYHGGDSGFDERDYLLKYLKNLDSCKYNVVLHEYINKPNCPPMVAFICHNHGKKKGRGFSHDF